MRVIQRVGSVWQSRGTTGLLRFLLSRIFTRRADVVFEADTEAYSVDVAWQGEGRLIWIHRENLAETLTPQLRAQIGAGEGADYLVGLKGRDMLFAVVDQNGRCLHHSFVLFETRTKVLLTESIDTPLFAHCVTVAEARGRKLYPRTLRSALGTLHRLGHSRAVINCAPDNTASVHGIRAAGFRHVRQISTWMLLTRIGWQVGCDVGGKPIRRFFLA